MDLVEILFKAPPKIINDTKGASQSPIESFTFFVCFWESVQFPECFFLTQNVNIPDEVITKLILIWERGKGSGKGSSLPLTF